MEVREGQYMGKTRPLRMILIGIFILLSFTFTGCSKKGGRKGMPKAEKGLLDLRGWDFEKDGPAALDGEWEFYWSNFYTYQDFQTDKTGPAGYLKVPGMWGGFIHNGKKAGNKGFATYRLVVKMDRDVSELGIKVPEICGAYVLYIDGQKVASCGTLGKSRETYERKIKPQISKQFDPDREIEIICHIAEFLGGESGFTYSATLGTFTQVYALRSSVLYLDFFLIGAMLIMGLYHFFLFFLRRKNLSPLFFGLFCFLIAGRELFIDEIIILEVFQTLSYTAILQINRFCLHLSIPVFMAYVWVLFPRQNSKTVNTVYISLCLFLVLVQQLLWSLSPLWLFIDSLFRFIALFGIGLVLFVMIKALIAKKTEAVIFAAGFLLLAATAINDVLFSFYLINTFYMVKIGLFCFIFSQAFLLSRKFSIAFVRVEKLSGELEDKNAELKKLDKLKDEFLANTSHELRTPLNGIIGIAESLLDGSVEKISETLKKNLSLIIISGRRLSGLVGDILDFSKLKNKDIQLQLKPVDMKVITEMVLHLSQPLVRDRKIVLKNSIPPAFPTVLGDENRIEQIMYNLVGNAIKFTRSGCVEVGAVVKDAFVEISVTDTGIGIPEQKLETIFESFEQADGSISRNYGGTGLGLSLTKSLVELHKGSIKVDSVPGKGSTFSFTIPLSGKDSENSVNSRHISVLTLPGEEDEPLKNRGEQNQAGAGNQGEKTSVILAVDDEPVNLQVLSNMLSVEKYRVTKMSGGQEVLEICKDEEKRPDIILLDIMMPGMSGFEVCRKLREKYNSLELPIIFLTAKTQVEDMVDGLSIGANDYIMKPFSKKVLLSRIETQITLKKQQNELKVKERLENEMQIARRIQTAIVPGPPDHSELEISVSMSPADEVGGDYYDVVYDRQGFLWLAIGDVSGHGVTAGLIMMMAQSAFVTGLGNPVDLTPKEMAVSVNRLLYTNINNRLHAEHFMTMTFLKYLGKGDFMHTGAHEPVIIYRNQSKSCELIETKGSFLGMIPDISHAETNSLFSLNKGDIMLLYTDGIIEARHKETRELLDLKRLQDMLKRHAGKTVGGIKESILLEVLEWCGNKPDDDITMVVVKRK